MEEVCTIWQRMDMALMPSRRVRTNVSLKFSLIAILRGSNGGMVSKDHLQEPWEYDRRHGVENAFLLLAY